MDPREFADEAHAEELTVVSRGGEYIVVGHAEVTAVAQDPARFSSQVSAHLQIPNGLDGSEHASARRLVDEYLEPHRVCELLPQFNGAARSAIAESAAGAEGETAGSVRIENLAQLYAVRAMQAWLQWPQHLTQRLLDWIDDNDQARGSGDREWTARVAAEFDDIIRVAVAEAPEDSETHRLATQHGLEHAEVVSILRNWTAGDLGSMARCIGVMAVAFAQTPALQDRVREILSQQNLQGKAEPVHREFDAIANEILRIDNPFVSNRRITTCPVDIGQTHLPENALVRIHWTAANRDPKVFDGFDPAGNAETNLVWGTGPHYCPGKTVSLLELRAFWTQVLSRFELVSVDESGEDIRGVRSSHGGWDKAPVSLRVRDVQGNDDFKN
ncbi:cytochrome P450 [Corynebacterium sp. L4756]|uniref:cytochrome P450 n=1 Tax=unclassified Corynebacterium TaxID=2624378 RepID=UPI00374D4CEC